MRQKVAESAFFIICVKEELKICDSNKFYQKRLNSKAAVEGLKTGFPVAENKISLRKAGEGLPKDTL